MTPEEFKKWLESDPKREAILSQGIKVIDPLNVAQNEPKKDTISLFHERRKKRKELKHLEFSHEKFKEWMESDPKRKDILTRGSGEVEEPTVEPIGAVSGGFAAGLIKGGIKTGIASGISALAAEPVVGQTIEEVAKIDPRLRLPAAIITGAVSGMTGEKLIEKAILKGPKKEALKSLKSAWKEFWSPMSTVPDSKELLKTRYKQFGSLDRSEDFVKGLYKKINKFDLETRKDIFRYLDDQIDVSDLPEGSRRLAGSIKERTKTIGRMMVKRGLITPEQFETHKGSYVHYLYGKHIIGDDANIALTPTGKMNLSETKGRNPNMTSDQRKELGLIEDAQIAVPVGMGKALTDIAKYDYLKALSDNPDWVWQPSLVKIGDQSIGIGRLTQEVNTYRKLAKEMPDNTQVQARFNELNSTLQKAIGETKNVPKDFAQLPVNNKYGPLSGAFIRKPIHDDLVPLMRMTADNQQTKSFYDTLVDINAKGMALFKGAKVAGNFPTAFRNIVSNVFQNNMRGRPLAKIPFDWVNAGISMRSKDLNYKLAKKHGLFKTSWATTEINDVLNEFKNAQGKGFGSLLNAVKNVAKYYGKIDDFAKHTIFVQLKKSGMSTEDAVLEAQKWGMDYSLAPRSVKHLRRNLIPFASYQYKIAPLIAESLKKRPWVIAKYAAIPSLMASYVATKYDMSDKDWKILEKKLPLYIKDNQSFTPLPSKDPDGRWRWVNLEYYFPWQNAMAIYRDMKKKDIKGLTQDIGLGNPFLDLYSVVKSMGDNKPPTDPFTRQPIYNELDKPSEKWLKFSEWIYNKWAPSMLTRQGAGGFTARIGEKDKWGKTITPGQAVGKWFGFNITSISPQQTAAIKKSKKRGLEQELNRILRDPRISKEKKKEAVTELNKRIKEIIGQ